MLQGSQACFYVACIRQCSIDLYMTVFIESQLFTKLVNDYLSEEEYAELQLVLARNPEAGKVVQGSGGVRKLRWARQGTGKSGGVRVVYFAKVSEDQIYLLVIYAKSAKDSIPGHLLKKIKEAMEQ